MARACSILASLFVALILIMFQNLQPTQGRYPSFRNKKNVMNDGSNGVSINEVNTMEAVVPAVKEETPPGPAATLPRPTPPLPPLPSTLAAPAAPVGGAPGHADNFRPTAPGHSPGIGNEGSNDVSISEVNTENVQKAPSSTPNVAHSLDANPDYFYFYAPGHNSPGIGHPTTAQTEPRPSTPAAPVGIGNDGSNDVSISEVNTPEAVVPAVKEATPPGPAATLPRPTPSPPLPPSTPAAPVGGAPGHADNFRPIAPGHSPRIGHSMQN